MDKFQWWTVENDVEWAKNVGVLSLLIIQLSLIQLFVKQVLQAITHFNRNIIKFVIQGVLVFIIKKNVDRNALLTGIRYRQNTSQASQGEGEGEGEIKGEGGGHLPKNYCTRHLGGSRGVEVSLFKGMHATMFTSFNSSNLTKGQLTYLCSQEVDEFGGIG